MQRRSITVVGAGIFGLWQALTLSGRGHRVRLVEASSAPFANAASRWAGAMISPDCEAEAAAPLVRSLGHEGLEAWRRVYPGLIQNGSLVVAGARDQSDLIRFGRMTHGFETIDTARISELEPALAGRYQNALFFPNEAHMETPHALAFLLEVVRANGVDVVLGERWQPDSSSLSPDDLIVDCRGLAARSELPELRGVRGERMLIQAPHVTLRRPVRLLHPRASFYVVPWSDSRFLVGATVIESEDVSAMTVRSALELLGMLYALHPGFGEAEILEISAGVRPAFADNVPHVVVRGARIHVNGAYRHGFLLAPVMAEAVADFIGSGNMRAGLVAVA